MSTWQNENKDPVSFLELETGIDFLLLENGGQIILEQTGTDGGTWINKTPKN